MDADLLLAMGVVGFPKTPITFKSGMVAPVYIDNRKLPSYPEVWKRVLQGMVTKIGEKGLDFEVVAGIEAAGIPHSAALGYVLGKPSVFVRKKTKAHGTKKLVEGGAVLGKRVLLIEDHITTGGSSLAGVHALRQAGARVTDCLAITSYGFSDSLRNFRREKVQLHVLVPFAACLKAAVAKGMIDETRRQAVMVWQTDPWGWRSDL